VIGKLAHPLNQPRFDVATGRVVEGYAILQPRVTPSLPIGREGSLFQRVFSSMTGIDAYDAAASDVYQDLFGEGSFAGKGIYDIDAFEAALAGRVPPDSLLSHDLLEGTLARAGLVSDVEVIEEFPSRYDVAAARSHRWARGDWQLLPWLLPRWLRRSRTVRDRRSLIGSWKMLDNLRRAGSADGPGNCGSHQPLPAPDRQRQPARLGIRVAHGPDLGRDSHCAVVGLPHRSAGTARQFGRTTRTSRTNAAGTRTDASATDTCAPTLADSGDDRQRVGILQWPGRLWRGRT
jgi:hypothetical protein